MESSIIERMRSFKEWFSGYEENIVTLRERDSMKQINLHVDELVQYVGREISLTK